MPEHCCEDKVDFSSFLHKIFLQHIEDDDDSIFHNKLPSISKHINYILEVPSVPLLEDQPLLDSMGTKLWNVSRAFAFFMIEFGTGKREEETDSEEHANDMRLLKVALATARGCLDVDQLGLCLSVLGKAAAREEVLSKRNHDKDIPDGGICKCSTEYYILRIVLSWRQDQIDITEHMFSKIDMAYLRLDSTMAERFAGVIYDIGKSLLNRGDHSSAASWLQRSYEALPQHEISQLGEDGRELRLAVLLGRVRANLNLRQEDGKPIIARLLDILEQEYGNRLPVILLSLDVISKAATPDSQHYYEKLCQLVRTVPVTESNVDTITRHLHRLNKWNSGLASEVLHQLLLQRLVLHNDISILERCFVTYVWMQTALSELEAGLDSLSEVVGKLGESWRKPLSEEAAQASVILLWKKSNVAYEHKEYNVAEKWCLLARHTVFENAGETNKAKLCRKIMLCALGKMDGAKGRQWFKEMPEASKSESLSQYLLYRVALLDQDAELAKGCLETLSKQGAGSENYILACIAETRHIEDKYQEVMALRILLDMLDKKSLDGIHLPALLRYTIRLLVAEVSSADQSIQLEVIENTCSVFEISSVKAIEYRDQRQSNPFSISEMDWFSRNSYNLAVKYCTIWDTSPVLSLLSTCIKFLDMYPSNLSSKQLYAVTLRRLLCHFLGALLSMARARTEADTQVQTDYYLDARNHIQTFRGLFCSETIHWDETHQGDLLKKRQSLLAFDFEAAVRLQQWESLDEIVDESESFVDDALFGTFSDALLCSGAPIENTTRVLQKITTHIVRRGGVRDTSKLSRWIRCQFQLALDSNVEMAENVLDQAYVLARESHSQHQQDMQGNQQGSAASSSCYPEEELEWLCTTAFNRAVDFYTKPDDASCRRWGQKSLDLAGMMHDGGLLYNVLRGRFEGLRWE
ncbi:hypothetical protein AJ78_02663 [Emergomyces pasteurianus Ep9510]|uniref:Protein ZIP4 homolog n=1 Tax=Emergomyces pasteurianus Ep9510 TaxID=1447872 RepID=A0A1J9PMX7_9EURO|nr:hypothetical protein AJ78_02663 [Emergomyces pasteurianus Ep9510]